MLIAALICDHLECKSPQITLRELDETLSKDVFKHYRRWCKNKGNLATPCSHRFSAQRFGKEKWASYPELASVYKAAVVKTMMYWCSDFLKERDDGIPGGNLRSQTMHAFAAFQNLIDISGPFFDPETTQKVVDVCRKGLLLYQKLAGIDKGRTDGRRTYKIIPKFHSTLELSIYIEETMRNPRYLLFQETPQTFGFRYSSGVGMSKSESLMFEDVFFRYGCFHKWRYTLHNIYLTRTFRYKPSISRYLNLWKPLYVDTVILFIYIYLHIFTDVLV